MASFYCVHETWEIHSVDKLCSLSTEHVATKIQMGIMCIKLLSDSRGHPLRTLIVLKTFLLVKIRLRLTIKGLAWFCAGT